MIIGISSGLEDRLNLGTEPYASELGLPNDVTRSAFHIGTATVKNDLGDPNEVDPYSVRPQASFTPAWFVRICLRDCA